MSWTVGEDRDRQRHIGYGVPATCDSPGCGESIDRGLGHACGGGVVGSVENCGLFFCPGHLHIFMEDDKDDGGGEWVCDQCDAGEPPYDPTPDTPEWIAHVLTDESWAQWREDQPEWAQRLRSELEAAL